jgi:hypothetical protein
LYVHSAVCRYTTTVRVSEQKPYQVREYTWCFNFPPRCSKYKINFKTVYKTVVRFACSSLSVLFYIYWCPLNLRTRHCKYSVPEQLPSVLWSEGFAPVLLMMQVFWDVMLCPWVWSSGIMKDHSTFISNTLI